VFSFPSVGFENGSYHCHRQQFVRNALVAIVAGVAVVVFASANIKIIYVTAPISFDIRVVYFYRDDIDVYYDTTQKKGEVRNVMKSSFTFFLFLAMN
jgi:tRNA(His) 5'-end guanylyltransferase